MCEEVKENKPPVIYCNSAEVSTSPYDFAILLRNRTLTSHELLVEVIMSPEHIKVFSMLLSHNIEKYEETFGPIPDVSPDVMQKLTESGKIKFVSGKQ